MSLNTTYNVTDPPFNAVGDGTTDDTTAIQNAIDTAAGNGGLVLFPSPSVAYKFTTLTVNGDDVTLASVGGPAILRSGSTTGGTADASIIFVTGDRFTMRNLRLVSTLSGHRTTTTGTSTASSNVITAVASTSGIAVGDVITLAGVTFGSGTLVAVTAKTSTTLTVATAANQSVSNASLSYPFHGHGITVAGDDALFENVEVTNFPQAGIVVTLVSPSPVVGGKRGRVLNCYSHGNGYAGLIFDHNTSDCEVLGGTYESNGGYNLFDGYGISFHSARARVIGTTCGGNFTNQIDAHETSDTIVVADNIIVFDGTESTTVANGISLAGYENGIISGNIVRGTGARVSHGIRTGPSTASTPARHVEIVGNVLTKFATAFAGIGAYTFNTDAIVIADNSINDVNDITGSNIAIDVEWLNFGSATDKLAVPKVVSLRGNKLVNSGHIELRTGADIELVGNSWFNSLDWLTAISNIYFVNTDKVHISRVLRRDNVAIGYANALYDPALSTSAPVNFSWRQGDRVEVTDPASSGAVAFLCTTSGTFGTLSTTGNSTSGSHIITNVGNTDNIVAGDFITHPGFSGTVEVIDVDTSNLSNKKVTVAVAASSTNSGGAIAFATPAFRTLT